MLTFSRQDGDDLIIKVCIFLLTTVSFIIVHGYNLSKEKVIYLPIKIHANSFDKACLQFHVMKFHKHVTLKLYLF